MATRSRLRSAPRIYLWVWGPMLMVLGVGSLIVHADFATGDGVTEKHLFGVFETNGWHGLAGLAAGIMAVLAAATDRLVLPTTLAIAVLAGVVAGLVFLLAGHGSAALGLIPVDDADAITLHLLPGLVGLLAFTAGISGREAEEAGGMMN